MSSRNVRTSYSTQGNYRKLPFLAALAGGLLCAANAAQAETSRGFIGPHEYALPDHLEKPIDIFVQYGFFDRNDRQFNGNSDRTAADDTQNLVGLSKYVHAWNLDSNPNIGFGWEAILIEVGARNFTQKKSASGFGDPIAGAFAWYKPVPYLTVGTDLLLQAPVGNTAVGGGDRWRGIQSVFWDAQFGNFNYTGDFEWDYPGRNNSNDARAGRTLGTEHRFAYKFFNWFEPYVGIDWDRQSASGLSPQNSETDLAIGSMFTMSKRSSLSVHWSHAIAGKNRPITNSLNARFVIAW